jgi:hypothetical protein
MHLSSIVIVVVRLFAIYWAVTALISFAALAGTWSFVDANGWHLVVQLVMPVVYLLLAIIAWFFSSVVTRKVIHNHDPMLALMDIRLPHFYSMGFLIVGLTLFLNHVGSMFQWVHWLAVKKSGDMLMYGAADYQISELSSHFVPGLLGLLITFQSPRFGRLMAEKSKREEEIMKRARDSREA